MVDPERFSFLKIDPSITVVGEQNRLPVVVPDSWKEAVALLGSDHADQARVSVRTKMAELGIPQTQVRTDLQRNIAFGLVRLREIKRE